ncbi:MAG TPA: LptE family protein [Chitinophagaceae bacterium]|nr:LptE family protein [Chitinophagaceae bacterium]
MISKINSFPPKKRTGIYVPFLKGIAGAFVLAAILFVSAAGYSGCGVYRFNDASIPDSVKTIKVNYIQNKAPYVNPQLSQQLTDRLRQKIVSQTKLSQTNDDNADWIVDATITGYSVTTSGISQQQVSSNRLTVSIDISINKQKSDKVDKYQVSRSFEFDARLSLQQAEASLSTEMLRGLTDDLFNKLFSEW